MKKFYFSLVHGFIAGFSCFVSRCRSPWIRKKITYSNVIEVASAARPGDIILTRTDGELSTILIPGKWKHVAIYAGNDEIIDATTTGVNRRHLADMMMKADYFAVMRLKDSTHEDGISIVHAAMKNIGKPYDFSFNLDKSDMFFCSELVMDAVNVAVGKQLIEPRETIGIPTFTPQDCYQARKKFDLIIEKI